MIKNIVRKTIFLILIIILIYIGYAKYIRKDAVVKLGRYGILVVLTNSMEPIIGEKELIVIKEKEQYELNDIVTYVDSAGILITHRILQIDEYSFMARGDNNAIIDENTDIHRIQGKVIYHSKILGIFVLYYLKIVIIVCLILWLILRRNKAKEEEDEKQEESETDNH